MASTNFINECKNRANANRLGKVIVDVGERDSHNLLPITATTQTIDGVTFTVNDDGTVLVNGVSTKSTGSTFFSFTICSSETLSQGNYIVSTGIPEGSGNENVRLWVTNELRIGKNLYEGEMIFPFSQDTSIRTVEISVAAQATANNILFKPMLRLASITDSTYEQYGKKYPITEEITNSDKLQSIDIDSGCYVDGNIIGSVYAKCLKCKICWQY